MARGMFSRPVATLCLLAVIVGIFLPPTGMGFSTCGMLKLFNMPCPGCGLTRSVSSFFHGQFAWSFHYHPFGWIFAVTFLLIGVTAPLPRSWREHLVARLSRLDRALGLTFLSVCVLLLVWGVIRILLVTSGAPSQQWWIQGGGVQPPFIQQD